MKFARIALLMFILVVAIASTVDAGKKKKKTTKKGSLVVRWNKKQSGISTWFTGSHLKGAACYGNLMGNSHVNAKDNWHIGAVNINTFAKGYKGVCFECAKVSYGKRSVVVRIIDGCSSCKPNHIDLTASAFKTLAPLSKGVIKMTYEFVRCPSGGSLAKWPQSPKVKKN
ncbi:hypothetical protein BGZ94_008381 [Podila epigama]|nr:hypothetical protein BGZ94_008381 [Podila epigama]